MASTYSTYTTAPTPSYSSQRSVAMAISLVSAIVLSPLYLHRNHDKMTRRHETRFSSGFVLPVVVAGLIIAIKTASSPRSMAPSPTEGDGASEFLSSDPSWVLRIGNSSWGLAGILMLLIIVLSWQSSAQSFFWR